MLGVSALESIRIKATNLSCLRVYQVLFHLDLNYIVGVLNDLHNMRFLLPIKLK